MQTASITWREPTKRADGTALSVADIRETEVGLSADVGTTWTVLAAVKPGEATTLTKDLADGGYKVRLVTVDTKGRRSAPAIGDVIVKTTAPPAAPSITAITVTDA